MSRSAYSFVRTFPPEPARRLCVDRHYLLCASAGALRLADDDQVWVLPPARAALIAAGHPIRVSLPGPVTTASVLFDPASTPSPPATLAVFDLSPLARALLAECGAWGEDGPPLTPYAEALFAALAAVAWRLAERPAPVVRPAGRSAELRRALHLTEQRLDTDLCFEDLAHEIGLAPRSLARRFSRETGMTWRAALRRMRVLRAIEQLAADDTPVTTIATRVGYSSLSAFNAAFQDLTGRTPSDYRRSCRG